MTALFSSSKSLRLIAVAIAACALTAPAHAERADRRKPVIIDAGQPDGDNKSKVLRLQKGVTITQGTLKIVGDDAVVNGDAGTYTATFRGAPVCFRQKKDNSSEVMRGQAQRVEYDQAKEKVEFFQNVIVHDGPNELRGDYVIYYMNTEKFEVREKPGTPVRMVMVPREKDEAEEEKQQATATAKDTAKPRLKTAKEIEMGRHEPLASKCVKETL
jgi:lipopolysaccharide export system protein LptA